MNVTIQVALAGGLFAVFAFIHFFVDWIFQSHAEAMVKHNDRKIRAKHCLIYTLGFVPILYILGFSFWEFVISLSLLFLSHFYLDTYHGVFLWAKHIRKPPEMTEPWKEVFSRVDGSTEITVHPPDAIRGFGEFVKTPLGKILMITLDQISHLIFLWPIVYVAMCHLLK